MNGPLLGRSGSWRRSIPPGLTTFLCVIVFLALVVACTARTIGVWKSMTPKEIQVAALIGPDGNKSVHIEPRSQAVLETVTREDIDQILTVFEVQSTRIMDRIFRTQLGQRYRTPSMVRFDDRVFSNCGGVGGLTGSFYCAQDRTLFLDRVQLQSLANELNTKTARFQSVELLAAYFAAQHIQVLLGLPAQIRQDQALMSHHQRLELNLRIELHAHCLAGLWSGYRWPSLLEQNERLYVDVRTRSTRPPPRLQPSAWFQNPAAQEVLGPTPAQIQHWFARGGAGGTLDVCDSFRAPNP